MSELYQQSVDDVSDRYLDHGVALHVILVALQLQVQDWRKRFEDDTLPSVLQSKTFSLILVFAIQRFYSDIIPERVV